MKRLAIALLSSLALIACTQQKNAMPAKAEAAAPGDIDTVIKQSLKTNFPDFPTIKSVNKTPVEGLYEVIIEPRGILYVDKHGSHMIEGNLIDIKSRKSLTAERVKDLTLKPDFAKLPLEDAIVMKKGDGSRKIAVFADPNCGFCKRYEAELAKLDNVTIYTFLYPVLGESSVFKAHAAWCAPDKAKAWHDMMIRGKVPPKPAKECNAEVIARNLELGSSFGITGTPSTIFGDGSIRSGMIEFEELKSLIGG